jgi:hypothetical protein
MAGLEVIKPAIDVGIATNQPEPSQDFWGRTVGLRHDHVLKVGGGIHQHRYDLHGAVLTLNHHRDQLGATPTGYSELVTVAAGSETGVHRTPDGTKVTLVPQLDDDLRTIVSLSATDPERTRTVLTGALGCQKAGMLCRIGETGIEIIHEPEREPTTTRDGTGIRYLTIQVRDLEAAHAHALRNGAAEGMAPLCLGDVAFISFVRLPDGDWVELSQRASLTGPLPG